MDPDPDPGGPKTCGSGTGFGTLLWKAQGLFFSLHSNSSRWPKNKKQCYTYIKNLSVETDLDPNAMIQVQLICNTVLVVNLGSGFGFSKIWIKIGIWRYNTIWIEIWI
jgi:hypothetical protein